MQTELIYELLKLQLRWDPGSKQLKVAQDLLHGPTLTGDVLTVLTVTWTFTEFSEGGFIGMGSCSRTLVAAPFLGLDNIVELIKDQRGEPHLYLNGFGRYDGNVKKT